MSSYTYDDIVTSMRQNGWSGDAVDVVKMPDGKFTSIDNTRILAAKEAGIDVQATVRSFDEALPDTMLRRFDNPNVPGEYARTWGEATQFRILDQGNKFSRPNPFGTYADPTLTYKVKNWYGL